jgi:hypothetical protein
MEENRSRIRRRQIIMFVSVLLILGLSLIFFSDAINPGQKLWSTNFWAGLIKDLGYLFAPAAVIALLFEWFSETRGTKELTEDITDTLRKEFDTRFAVSQASKEITALYPGRYSVDFPAFFSSAKENIDILVTNLQTVQMFLGILADRAKAGVSVRVLALNPNHSFLANRFSEIGLRAGDQFRLEIISSLRNFCLTRETRLTTDLQDNFVIKIFNNPPTVMIFRRDDRVILAFILRQGRSRDQLHIEFVCSSKDRDERPADCFVKHFNVMWQEAQEVDYKKVEEMSQVN